jgi:ribosomal protein S18 acetylase RimI-like enzyme
MIDAYKAKLLERLPLDAAAKVVSLDALYSPESTFSRSYQAEVLDDVKAFSPAARDYLLRTIRKPDAGSVFDRKSKLLRLFPDFLLLSVMQARGYGGQLFTQVSPGAAEGKVCAHTFFQRHSTSLHLFSVYLAPDLRGQGIGYEVTSNFIEYARTRPEIEQVRISGGGNAGTRLIFEQLCNAADDLGLKSTGNYFLKFTDRSPRRDYRKLEDIFVL